MKNRWFSDPLIHFLAIGSLFFLGFYLFSSEEWSEDNPYLITVDKPTLLNFLQFRSRAFKQEVFESKLAEMSDEERQKLIDDYVAEEVLYREALSLGMDKEDYIIRRRLVQKVEFVTRSMAEQIIQASDDDLKQWYERHQDAFFQPATITFTHIFFNSEERGGVEAKAAAQANMEELQAKPIAFSDAISEGDRFAFHRNYVERNAEFIDSHFGAGFAGEMFDSKVDQWSGPYESTYGWHLILISAGEAGRYLSFEEVRERVESEWNREELDRLQKQAIEVIKTSYSIDINLDGVSTP